MSPTQLETTLQNFSTIPASTVITATTTTTSTVKSGPDELQKKILEALNKNTVTEMIAKKSVEAKTGMTKEEKNKIKNSLLNDDKIKAALSSLFKRTN